MHSSRLACRKIAHNIVVRKFFKNAKLFSMNVSNALWQGLSHRMEHPPIVSSSQEVCIIRFAKNSLNFAYKGVIALAMAVALLATPFFMVLDCFPCVSHQWTQVKIPTILEFYSGQPNDKGVTLQDIWGWDDDRLEEQHDFIQWLFPIEKKGVNPTAPPTNSATIEAFKKDKQLQGKMLKSFEVMLSFYGFSRSAKGKIIMEENFNQKGKNWLSIGNHNYRRITRILKSLRLHGLEKDAQAFLDVLTQVYYIHANQIGGDIPLSFWKSALAESR